MRTSDLVFFLSGAAALVHETVWARLLTRVLGSDAGASAIVVATFMGGMGLGAWACGPLARRVRAPVRWFAACEVAVGLWAAASPWIFASLRPVDGFAARALVAALLLLPPTFALGATFPLMGRIAIESARTAGSAVSRFYGANTLGAAAGALVSAFVFMPSFGLAGALRAGALLELAAAGAALAWLRAPSPSGQGAMGAMTGTGTTGGVGAASDTREASANPPPHARTARLVAEPMLWVALALGAASLGLEIVLMRIFVTVAGASVYSFAIVLAVFLAGLGLGSRQLAVAHARRSRDGATAERAAHTELGDVFHAALWAAPCIVVGLLALRFQLGERDIFSSLQNRVPASAGLARLWASHVLLAALATLPPAIAFGRALPAIAQVLITRHPSRAREDLLGWLYGANTLGALAGSLGAAFVLLPMLGMRAAIGVLLVLVLAAAALAARGRAGRLALGACITALLATWLLASGTRGRGTAQREVIVLAHDAHATVAVEDSVTSSGARVRSLRVQGKPEASTAPVDVRLQLLLGHVPALLHGAVRDALVIGMGSGMTAGSLLDLPELERVTIFEISPAIEPATRAFSAWNHALLDDPRTRLVIADGRHALATSGAAFDLITSDPVHPWTRGSSDLYTLEHFTSMAAHLRPGGVASQWLPLYELSELDVRTVIATWTAAFEHTSAWLSAYDLILIGARAELPNAARLCTLPLPPDVAQSLAPVGVRSAVDIGALMVARDADLRAYADGLAPMRDDRPVLEFRAPLSYLGGYSTEVLRWAGRAGFVETLDAPCRARAIEVRALLARFLERLPQGWGSAATAYGAELIALPARAGN